MFEFKDKKIREYIGDIYDFLESRKIRSLKELEQNTGKNASSGANPDISDNKQLYERKKQLEREIRKVSGQVEKSENDIHEKENLLGKLNEQLTDPSKLEKGEDVNLVYQQYTALQKELDSEIENWEKLSLELEELQKNRASLK